MLQDSAVLKVNARGFFAAVKKSGAADRVTIHEWSEEWISAKLD
jgi:hypothetical protein